MLLKESKGNRLKIEPLEKNTRYLKITIGSSLEKWMMKMSNQSGLKYLKSNKYSHYHAPEITCRIVFVSLLEANILSRQYEGMKNI